MTTPDDPTTTPATTTPVEQTESTMFSKWLADYGYGHTDGRLTLALREVVEAVMLHDKTGTVSLKLTVSKSGGDGVKVTTDVSSKPPESKPGGQFFFVTKEPGAGLSRNHPSQPTLPGMPT